MSLSCQVLALLTDKNDQRIIAYDENNTFLLQTLQNRTSQIRQEISKQKNKRWVLAVEDVFSFASGFLALASLGCTIILPPNLKQGALEDICLTNERILTDKQYENIKHPILNITSFQFDNTTQNNLDFNDISNSCAIEMFTSGSSGEPKKIAKTLLNIEAEIQVLEKTWGQIADQCVFFSTVTHLHIYGLLFRLLWPLTTARPFYNKNYLFPDDLTKAMKKFPNIILVSSPAHLKRIPQMTDLPNFCSKLKLVVSSGGPLGFESANAFTKEGSLTPLEVFGSTETGGIAWRYQITPSTPWQAFDCLQIKQDQETGTLSLKSPFMPETGWVHTSDLIELVSENSFHLKGRADRIVKIEEKRIGLAHLESKIIETGLIEDAYVTVLTSEEQNGRLFLGCIFTLNATGQELFLKLSWKLFIDTLRRKLALFFDDIIIPRQWRIVQEIPLNPVGKKVANDLKKFFTPALPLQPVLLHTDKTPSHFTCQLYIPMDLFYFQGHFDGFPIIPGVAQINWAVEYAKKSFDIQDKFYQMANIKFKKVIRPGTVLQLIIQRDEIKTNITFTFENSSEAFSSGIIKFKKTDEAKI